MWDFSGFFNNVPERWHSYWGHMGPGMMGWGWYGSGWLGIVLMAGWWIIMLMAVAGLVKWIFFHRGGSANAAQRGDSALEILKQRYARGEIDKEQYRAMKHDLES